MGNSTVPPSDEQIIHREAPYTCPMHPEVTQPGPGPCPRCGIPRFGTIRTEPERSHWCTVHHTSIVAFSVAEELRNRRDFITDSFSRIPASAPCARLCAQTACYPG